MLCEMSRLVRVLIVMALAAVLTASACSGSASSGAGDDDSSTSAGAAASADELADRVDLCFERSLSVGLRDRRALVVSQGDRVLLERYFDDSDEATTANVFSVTKSIMATLVGVALDQGHADDGRHAG